MSKKEFNQSNSFKNGIFGEIRSLIEQSRQQVALTVNSEMTLLYWQI
jgi:hypothetical protein